MEIRKFYVGGPDKASFHMNFASMWIRPKRYEPSVWPEIAAIKAGMDSG